MADPVVPDRVPASWLTALEQGQADIAAGRTSDLETFLQALEAADAAGET